MTQTALREPVCLATMDSDAGPRDTDGDRVSLSRRTIAWHQGPRNAWTCVSATPQGPLFKLPPTGGPGMPFCERCGNLIGPVAGLAQVGLRPCRVCGVHACDRCWRGARGACPGCGSSQRVAKPAVVAAAATAPDRPTRSGDGPTSDSPPGRRRGVDDHGDGIGRRDRREPLPAGGCGRERAGRTGARLRRSRMAPDRRRRRPPARSRSWTMAAPSATTQVTSTPRTRPRWPGRPRLVRPRVPPRAAAAVATNPTPRPTVAPGPTTAPTQGPPTPTPGSPPSPTPTPTSPPFPPLPTPTPDPTATPTPASTPTPAPTPAPTPQPTPAPTPECIVVPNLVGLTVANARAEWADAGFTGSFTPGAGLNNKIVESQSQAVGACLPATTSVTVTYS